MRECIEERDQCDGIRIGTLVQRHNVDECGPATTLRATYPYHVVCAGQLRTVNSIVAALSVRVLDTILRNAWSSNRTTAQVLSIATALSVRMFYCCTGIYQSANTVPRFTHSRYQSHKSYECMYLVRSTP